MSPITKVLQYAVEILLMVGFSEDVGYDETGKRNDPGLLWLSNSVPFAETVVVEQQQVYRDRSHGEPCMDPMRAEVAAVVDSWAADPGRKKAPPSQDVAVAVEGEPPRGRKQYITRSRAASTANAGRNAKTPSKN
ncbi:hypothetical protein POTOM_010925 [Populus tomentosa]|uniref:Uncharacterized protein n=1 Tax=Populus tomentosa TaxID=118781 RepID=A0A8X8A9D8_POPTO|nr:hypothetical protein POTOM_010925 [Populus tomentosa]